MKSSALTSGKRRSQQRTGAAPTIRYFELQMLLDNEAGTVTEWSQVGEKSVRPSS